MSKMKNSLVALSLFLGFLLFLPVIVHAQGGKQVSVTATTSSVKGNGTPGRITKWVGNSSPSVDVSDSIITESNSGQIGIGTITPTSRLTVAGTVETTLGGYKFPDGTVQTTAALASISHDATLTGDGTPGSPLGIASGQTVDHARDAFQQEVFILISEGRKLGSGHFSVPVNKRLVVEYIAIKAVGDDPFDTLDISARLAGSNTMIQILPVHVVGRISAFDKQVRIYADGEITMVATLVRDASSDATLRVTLSGYLVDLP